MIIITHHSELEDAADTVYKVEKIEGISRVRGELNMLFGQCMIK
jgi:hypothetical protein